MNILRKLYNWTIEKSKSPKAVWFLSLVSFTESSIFPIPPDIILIPMIIAKRINAFFYALVCTISSVIGGIIFFWMITKKEIQNLPFYSIYTLALGNAFWIGVTFNAGYWIAFGVGILLQLIILFFHKNKPKSSQK